MLKNDIVALRVPVQKYVIKENTFKGYYAARNGSFLTSVSGQHIGPIFKGQESKKETFLRFSFDSLSYIIVLVSISLITSFTYT